MADHALTTRDWRDWPRSGRPAPLPGRHAQWAVRWLRRTASERRLEPVSREGRVDVAAVLRSAELGGAGRATQLRRAFRAAQPGVDDLDVTIAALVVATACGEWPRVEGLIEFLERSFERAELDAGMREVKRLPAGAGRKPLLAARDWDEMRFECRAMATRARTASAATRLTRARPGAGVPVVLRLSGGLGNQLFQYGAALAYATRIGVPLRLDLEEYEHPRGLRDLLLGRLAMHVERAGWLDILRARRWRHQEKRGERDDALLAGSEARELTGHWEHPMYFEPVREASRRRIQPRDPEISRRARATVEGARTNGGPVVGLHLRRGDRSPGRAFGAPLSTLPMSYYREAATFYPANATFVVCSDSPIEEEWVRAAIGDAAMLVCRETGDPVEDLFTLAACDHLVLSAGTFSWWAAYLGDRPGRRVIAPDAIQAMSALRAVSPATPPVMPGWTVLRISDWRDAR